MAVTWRGPVQLYGPDRTQRRQALELQARLQQSHVLRDDDYNLTHHHLRDAAWHIAFPRVVTSSALLLSSRLTGPEAGQECPHLQHEAVRVIVAAGLFYDRTGRSKMTTIHDHHFKLGNDSGDFVPPSAYRESVTRGDFDMKPTTKVIAPRDNPARQSGSSEYTSTFSVLQNRERSAPTFPKVNTFKMALPLDPTRFHVQRGSQLQLGCEQQSSDVSEIKRAYGKVTSAEYTTHTLADGDARRKFKEQELASSIFRPGDFNDTAGGMHTTSMIDYAPRTTPQGEILGSQRGQVQTRAHFQLGFDSEQNGSMYDKDYELSAMATRSVPKLHPPPDAGHATNQLPAVTTKQSFEASVPFLHTKVPLPYSQTARESETANNYSGVFAGGVHALDRRRSRNDLCRERTLDTKATHYVAGYNPPDYNSYNSVTFQGGEKSDDYVRPAGKVEIQPEADFVHLKHSANIQDDHVAGSRDTNTSEDKNEGFYTSIMKSDYSTGNKLTAHQLRSVEKYEKLLAKPFAESHFFHTDNSRAGSDDRRPQAIGCEINRDPDGTAGGNVNSEVGEDIQPSRQDLL
ncbi:hypothetical protein C0Q70_13440 [Pomacea canaliculata]|uniref:Uncharacterized protein n=1 Tax=Pomacea canaliculata TaxID=400727 RepID=A0A2T7NX81_POMCA|nr:hypothetical protein C0Q70_13440 [Pomacea canaliculata]